MIDNIDGVQEESKGEILVLEGDVERLCQIYEALTNVNYEVSLSRTMMEALERLKISNPLLIIIGRDLYEVDPQTSYNSLSETIRAKGVQSLVMSEAFFTEEVINKVEDILR